MEENIVLAAALMRLGEESMCVEWREAGSAMGLQERRGDKNGMHAEAK